MFDIDIGKLPGYAGNLYKYIRQKRKRGFIVEILIAILSGMLMSVQGVFNTDVTKQSSLWVANSWVQFTALAVCLAAWGISDRSSFAALWKVQPKYVLVGGVIGAFITLTVVKSMNTLGPAQAVLFIVVAQMITAYVIELLGWFGTEKVDWSVQKLNGMVIAISGVVIFQLERKA